MSAGTAHVSSACASSVASREPRRWAAVAAWGLAVFWLSSAVVKLVHLEDFREVIAGHVWVPLDMVALVARVVCSWELLVGVLLLAPQGRRAAHAAGSVLLFFFTAVLAMRTWSGDEAGCGCGLWETTAGWAMMRNLALAGLHLFLLGHGLRDHHPSPVTQ